MSSMTTMGSMSLTSVAVRAETLRRLKAYKLAGASYDDVLNELMDLHPPADFVREHLRSLAEDERVSWPAVKRRTKL